jgi:hypothetical protein
LIQSVSSPSGLDILYRGVGRERQTDRVAGRQMEEDEQQRS